jgi:hypothetical protein
MVGMEMSMNATATAAIVMIVMKHDNNKENWNMNQIGRMTNVMDYTKNIIPILWNFLDTRRNSFSVSINICTIDDELIISIINPKEIKRFKHTKNVNLVENLNACLPSY